jgi:hypothetical protein
LPFTDGFETDTIGEREQVNVMSTIHLRKLIATLVRENGQRDAIIEKPEERIGLIEQILREQKALSAGTSSSTSILSSSICPKVSKLVGRKDATGGEKGIRLQQVRKPEKYLGYDDIPD